MLSDIYQGGGGKVEWTGGKKGVGCKGQKWWGSAKSSPTGRSQGCRHVGQMGGHMGNAIPFFLPHQLVPTWQVKTLRAQSKTLFIWEDKACLTKCVIDMYFNSFPDWHKCCVRLRGPCLSMISHTLRMGLLFASSFMAKQTDMTVRYIRC